MIRILTIIGARPQIIKAAAISRAIRCSFSDKIEEIILHTGQHYDENMSGTFFSELGIPSPHINLHVGSGSHGQQTAKMIEGIEKVLKNGTISGHKLDGVILYGDTNSTLAGAVAAAKMQIPVFHVEAGLRSFNMTMPEEQNRIVCDRLSSVLFAPTQTAVDNLINEGFGKIKCKFINGKEQNVVLSGDVMFDNSIYYANYADDKSNILNRLELQSKKFILATIHRDSNTDNKENLSSIFRALLKVSELYGQKIVLPLHPRTRKMLQNNMSENLYYSVVSSNLVNLIEPVGFFDMIQLERNASLVMTDSGGVQKEAFFYETPCVILRPETEWKEIIEAGAGILAGADESKIIEATEILIGKPIHFPKLFGDSHAAELILSEIIKYLS